MPVIFEEEIKSKMQKRSRDYPKFGLLVGQKTLRHDIVVHAVETTPNDFEEPVRYIPESTVAENTFTISLMLPGGFNVIGFYLLTSEEIWNTDWNLKKVKLILSRIRLNLRLKEIFKSNTSNDSLSFLHIDPDSQTYRCWMFSYEETTVAINPVKFIFCSLKFSFYVGRYSWNYLNPYKDIDPSEKSNNFDKYWKQIDSFKDDVNKGTMLINGKKVPSGTEKIKNHLMAKESSSSDEETDDQLRKYRIKGQRDFTLFLCVFKPIYNYSWSCIQVETAQDQIFVHESMTIDEVCKAVKEDLVRSWASKLHLHIERIAENKATGKEKMKKISVLLECSKIPFYYYVTQREPLCSKGLQDKVRKNLFLGSKDRYLLLDYKDFDYSSDTKVEKWLSEEPKESGMNKHVIAMVIFLVHLCIIYNVVFTKKYMSD